MKSWTIVLADDRSRRHAFSERDDDRERAIAKAREHARERYPQARRWTLTAVHEGPRR